MRFLITAGSTQTPIDQVRAITNIFRGRTGTAIAEHLASNEHEVVLITSSPQLVNPKGSHLQVLPFKTFDQLEEAMRTQLIEHQFDVVIHSAAVSDYRSQRCFVRAPNDTLKEVEDGGKIASGQTLLLELTPTKKLVNAVRGEWGFRGTLVMFKLQVGMKRSALVDKATASMQRAGADIIIANCLEWHSEAAILVDRRGTVSEMPRSTLPRKLEAACVSFSA